MPIEKIVNLPELQKNVANLVSNVFLCILGDIQHRLKTFNNDEKDEGEITEIAVPPHIKSCNELRNQEDDNEMFKSEEEDEEEEKDEKNQEEKEEKEGKNDIIKKEKSIKSKENEIENSGNKSEKESSNNKKELIISEKASSGEKLKSKDDKLKSQKIDISDLIDITKTNNKMISKEEEEKNDENNNNSFDDFDDMNFDMNEEEEDTHYPKYFIKDKSIIQMNEYPESIKEMNNKIIDSQNAFE